jgi:DNA-binding NarL/FixJ family response regulator
VAGPPPVARLLTDRERDVLDLVSRPGGSRKGAAAALGVSHKSVDRVLASVFRKLGVDNIAAAARGLGRAEWPGVDTPLSR